MLRPNERGDIYPVALGTSAFCGRMHVEGDRTAPLGLAAARARVSSAAAAAPAETAGEAELAGADTAKQALVVAAAEPHGKQQRR